MSWRVIAHGDQVWHVDAVAERRANTAAWQLVLSFRAASDPLPGGGGGSAPVVLDAVSLGGHFEVVTVQPGRADS